jgi:hypothetical protein
VYVLLQMVGLLIVARLLHAATDALVWFAIACGYICAFSGVPVVVVRALRPYDAAAFRLRVALLALLAAAVAIPDVIAYMFWQRNGLDFTFSVRHVVNPFRALANLQHMSPEYQTLASLVGVTGLLAYIVLIRVSASVVLEPVPVDADPSETGQREPGGADLVS